MADSGSLTRGRRNPLHLTLGRRQKDARLAAGFTRKAVEQRAGISSGMAHGIEERGRVPGCEVVERIARALKMSPCLLAFGVPVPFVEEEEGAPLRSAKIGERLRGARQVAGLSLRQLAEDTRPAHDETLPPTVSHTTIRLTEDGKTIPSVATVEALAQALRISPCWLAFGESDPTGPRFPPPIKKKKPNPAPRKRTRAATVSTKQPAVRRSRTASEKK